MFKEQRQRLKLLELKNFDGHKNTTVLIIAILDCSEIDMEVSDISMETAKSNGCREILRNNGDTNDILAMT